MKKTKKWLLCGLMATSIALMLGAAACSNNSSDNGSGSGSVSQETEKSITFDAESVTITQFDSTVLTYTLTGISATTPITWTSSDPSAVAVKNGKITAYKTGTVIITVAAGGYSDTISVAVEASSDMPMLTLSQTDTRILVGKTVTIYPEVKFRGEAVDEQPDVEWTTTSDAITLTQKADGSVTITGAKATTQAVVQAKATYLGKEITNAVLVNVVEDVALSLNATRATLYTYAYGEAYKTTTTLSVTVTSTNETVENPSIEWTTDDPSVVTVNNGVVTVVGTGEATITAKYLSSTQKEYTAECVVTVAMPSIDTGKSAKIYLNSADGDQTVDIAEEFGIADTSLTYKVVDVATGAEWTTTSEKTATFHVADKKLCGERAVRLVVDGKVELNATLVVVTKTIGTTEELLNMRTYGEVTDRELVGKTESWDTDRYKDKFYGYYVLTADIDLSNAGEIGEAYIRGDLGEYGMHGGLDGQGHTIFGGKFSNGGLFGGLNKNGVVRNVSFMNTTVVGSLQGVLGTSVCGLVENVLFDVTSTNATGISNIGGIAEWVSGTIRNCVIQHPIVPDNLTSGCICVNLCNGGTIDNVYLFGGGKQINYDNKSETTVSNIYAYKLDADLSEIEFSGLTGNYWKFDGAQVYFDGCQNLLKAIAKAGKYPETMTNGSRETLAALPAGLQYQIVVDEAMKAFVTLEGNVLTVSNDITKSFTFTITLAKWNGLDLGVSKTVRVVKIENIVVANETEYTLYTYSATDKRVPNTSDLSLDLSKDLAADIPAELTWSLVRGTNTLGTLNATASGKTLRITASNLAAVKGYGACTLVGISKDGNYKLQIPVLLITMKIDNASKNALTSLAAYGDVAETSYGGYFVLAENINATGLTLNNAKASFSGTFDGRGYAISGATYSTSDTNKESGGLFGAIETTAVVKNLALTNSKILCHPYVYFGILTGGATSFGTIDNCYVEIVETKSNVEGYNLQNIACGVVSHQGGGTMTNVVVKYASGAALKYNVCDMVYGGAAISNVYVIGGSTNHGWVQDGSSASVVSISSMTEEQFASFDSNIWSLTEGVPSFKATKSA